MEKKLQHKRQPLISLAAQHHQLSEIWATRSLAHSRALSPNQQLFEGALQKQPDAWSEGVPLPLAFDCYATKVFCPPWYWNWGPGWLSSQGVLQSDETTKI